jgi:hypothetical protein
MSSDDYGSLVFGGARATEFFVDGDGSMLGYAHGPERALFAALLFDGIQHYLRCRVQEEAQEKELVEAREWVHAKGDDYVFSFENVCQALGICPEFMRLGLVNAGTAILKTRRQRQAS